MLIRVHATALNRADMMQRMGNYPAQHGASEILGLELSGEVVETGARVRGFSVGDRVYGLSGGGGYAELATMHESLTMAIPDEFTYHEAASIPEVFFTANTAVRTLGQTLPGERLLVHAGGSGRWHRGDPDRSIDRRRSMDDGRLRRKVRASPRIGCRPDDQLSGARLCRSDPGRDEWTGPSMSFLT